MAKAIRKEDWIAAHPPPPVPEPRFGSRDQPMTVSELTECIRDVLSGVFAEVWVVGEIANFKRHQNGHLYFTLRDNQCPLPAVLWASRLTRLRFELQDGLEVICRGKLDVYPPHGKYQMLVEEIMPRGLGALELAFKQLKEKLEKRGWLDPARKKPLPRFPRRVALVTSPTGAVIRDMVRIIRRRWPPAQIILCAVSVQGDRAVPEIIEAIQRLNRLRCADVMIVGRGGGSTEDLWVFNDEKLAEAIFHSDIPVVSAVGHETDFTIADFVADRRAATPSEAAEMVVPDRREVLETLKKQLRRMTARMTERVRHAEQILKGLANRRVFRSPFDMIHDRAQRLDELSDRLERAVIQMVKQSEQRLLALAARLEGLSPLKVLSRGYSITQREGDPKLLRSASEVRVGDRLVTRLAEGQVVSRVESAEVLQHEPLPLPGSQGAS
ncbi:MAG: exodeoxyribonuclease VII large subunit [Gemmatales bacterium]|nr:exodeoxyribonuclease VII large subunit [Gemmatales bacterium]MDW8385877.1 exodeoxyribonuclease VII large subunit [Gemmatales bacterium]